MDKNEIISLLNVKEESFSGILKKINELEINIPEKNIDISFQYIRFQDGNIRADNFVEVLLNHITPFCLPRAKFEKISPADFRHLYKEAVGKFATPDNNKSGEPGELILYFVLEGYLQLPKIFTKMNLKTNHNMHVHGSDGVHFGIENENINLYFGESKLYKTFNSGVRDALDSIKNFNLVEKGKQRDFEINVISDHLDIPKGELRNKISAALNPYSEERSNLKYYQACFIGFDYPELQNKWDNPSDFENLLIKKSGNWVDYLMEKLNENPNLLNLNWQFILIPFNSVEDFRQIFISSIKDEQ